MRDILIVSLVNAVIGSAGATTFLIFYGIIRQRWF